MKIILLIMAAFAAYSQMAQAGKCNCKCVVKDDDNSYSLKTGEGIDRESAGEDLKKNLGKKKCELSPECKGNCYL